MGGLIELDLSYNLVNVSLDRILPDPLQPRRRYDPVRLDELVLSLQQNGQVSFPMVEGVAGKTYLEYISDVESNLHRRLSQDIGPRKRYNFLVVGHRRCLAARKAGFETFRVKKLKNRLTLLERRIVQVDEDSQLGLTPWARAKETARLLDLVNEERVMDGRDQITIREFAHYNGTGEGTVRDRLAYVNNVSDEVKKLVENGNLNFSKAVLISRIEDSEIQLIVAANNGMEDYDKVRKVVLAHTQKGKGIFSMQMQSNHHPTAEWREIIRNLEKQTYHAFKLCCLDLKYKEALFNSELKETLDAVKANISFVAEKLSKHSTTYERLKKQGQLNGKKANSQGLNEILEAIEEQASEEPVKKQSPLRIKHVLLSKIRPDPENPRGKVTEEEIDSLAASIIRDGQYLNPLLVSRTKYKGFEIIAGERRYWAGKKVEEITGKAVKAPVIVIDDIPKRLRLQLQKDENSQVPFSEPERAYALGQIYDLMEGEGFDGRKGVDELVKELCISRATGLKALRYEKSLDPKVKRLVEENLLQYSTACLLMKLEPEEQVRIAYDSAIFNQDSKKVKSAIDRAILERTQSCLFSEDELSSELNYNPIAKQVVIMLSGSSSTFKMLDQTRDVYKRLGQDIHFVKAFLRLEQTVDNFAKYCSRRKKLKSKGTKSNK